VEVSCQGAFISGNGISKSKNQKASLHD